MFHINETQCLANSLLTSILNKLNMESHHSNGSSGGKCPFSNPSHRHTAAGALSNSDWWPNQLNLKMLHKQMGSHSDDEDAATMMEAMLRDLPIIKLVQFTQGAFSEAQVEALVEKANQCNSRF